MWVKYTLNGDFILEGVVVYELTGVHCSTSDRTWNLTGAFRTNKVRQDFKSQLPHKHLAVPSAHLCSPRCCSKSWHFNDRTQHKFHPFRENLQHTLGFTNAAALNVCVICTSRRAHRKLPPAQTTGPSFLISQLIVLAVMGFIRILICLHKFSLFQCSPAPSALQRVRNQAFPRWRFSHPSAADWR